MRFAYIDSQGKEVTIPSVDALRLRIELGAIVDGTIFHDSSTGKWAPAEDHEIYRTLQRELADLSADDFVAPPPMADVPEPAPKPVPEDQPAAAPPEKPSDRGAEPADVFDLGITMELSSEMLSPEPTEEPAEAGDWGQESNTVGDPLPLAGPAPDMPGAAIPLSSEWGEEDDDDGASAGQEISPPPLEAGDELPDWATNAAGDAAYPEGDHDRETMGGTDADPYPAYEDESPHPADRTDLYGPMTGRDDQESTDWLTGDASSGWASDGGDAGGLGRGYAEPGEPGDEVPPRPAPRPRNAPAPRKLTRARTPGGGRVVVMALAAVVLGAGVWFGSRFVSGMLGSSEPAVTEAPLPELPAELLPAFERVRTAATDALLAGLSALPQRGAIPDAPDRDWLTGSYLAQPARFSAVRGYWESVAAYTSAAQAAEAEAFLGAVDAELAAASFPETQAVELRARLVAGWEAANSARAEVYGQLQAVAASALDLHDFLMTNEGQIRYEPATGGVSRDPVLEAVPATEALGVAMWDRVSAITGALDELGYLDTMATEGLLGTFLEKLGSAAVR